MDKKRVRDGAGTQVRILDAAERLFSERGFSGTSIGRISKASGISDGLILHHFKTKDNLYTAVRERVASRYNLVLAGKSDPAQESAGLGGMMHRFFQTAFGFFKHNITYHRISLWSYLEGRTDVVDNEAEITARMVTLVRSAQEGCILEDDFDPVMLLAMAVGSIHYWLRYRTQFKKILNYSESLAELDDRFLDQSARLLIRGVIKQED
ncbi:TetR/AcrR family transcriptional regulator [bacterium]|nr:TetR/AcrR family transcriptional regulator [bacterium]